MQPSKVTVVQTRKMLTDFDLMDAFINQNICQHLI